MKPRLVLLDADAVIHLHEIERWDQVKQSFLVTIPETVARAEVIYYKTDCKGKTRIDLVKDSADGSFGIEGVDFACIQSIQAKLGTRFCGEYFLHTGELEALALLEQHVSESTVLCTGDFAATMAACCLGYADNLCSLECLLKSCGAQSAVQDHFTEASLKKKIVHGREYRIQFYT